MKNKKTYWKNVEQIDSKSTLIKDIENKEFANQLPVNSILLNKEGLEAENTNRRDFLKYVGFSTTAAALAACEGPVIKSVPYVVQPEQIRPGIANYYATAIADGFDFASILVKTREGRPIKIESNKEAPDYGSANARVHASVLSLYDTKRIQLPKIKGEDSSWDELKRAVLSDLNSLSKKQDKVVLLTQTFASPTTSKIIKDLVTKFPNIEHITLDTVPSNYAVDSFQAAYGFEGLVDYDFSKSDFIVSVDADFLGDWQGGGYDSKYVSNRVPDKKTGNGKMSKHVQFESNMTLTGANADIRVPATPTEQKKILSYIYSSVKGLNNKVKLSPEHKKSANFVADGIKKFGSKAVIVSGLDDKNAQDLILDLNNHIKSQAIDNSARLIRTQSGNEVDIFLKELLDGKISGLITVGVNPIYSLSEGEKIREAVKNLVFSLSFSMKEDETSSVCKYIAAVPHYLESWGDYEFKEGHYFLAQPTIRPLFNTMQFQDFVLSIMGSTKDYYSTIKAFWKQNILNGKSWNKILHDGFFKKSKKEKLMFNPKKNIPFDLDSSDSSESDMELVLYTKIGMGCGQQANNPWLQEFPDPITRVTWDNYLTISSFDAKRIGLKNMNVANGALNGSFAKISDGKSTLQIPVVIQPGQAKGSVGLALGYGRKLGIQEEMQTGENAFVFFKSFRKNQLVNVELTDGFHEFACTQLQNTLMGRGDIIKETTLEVFNTKDKEYWNPIPKVSKNHIETAVTSKKVDIWENFDRSVGHHFNLSIDLNACTGCGACVIACHSENNVPVVGKREIRKSRDMHWLRIDRYYSSEDSFEEDVDTKDAISGIGDSLTTFGKMEKASENPQVAFHPVMCQHCNHAPCETVCPVAASSHGRQGQNHMAYNRCVGTRYCANNCPYKVRRFNWFLYNKNDEFDYHMNNDLGRMVLNPDVVVRSRGVMEKCSMCIQITQKTILDAKLEGRQIKDGDFKVACSSACTTGAMVFGDINDKESKVSELKANDRMYHLLESVGTKPNVMYQTKIRNT
ncbi:TAT-variant-translocated molybdopterin oxidoreductase [bacterium]|nr:TAT-variant-translocated molybdopterin oxidoreductase [Bacteroidota bacterium]MDC3064094.1 TAT-variant-translocated molybdopterin oxidoreductase [bacterium]